MNIFNVISKNLNVHFDIQNNNFRKKQAKLKQLLGATL